MARAAARAGFSVIYLETIGFGLKAPYTDRDVMVAHARNLVPRSAQPQSRSARRINHWMTARHKLLSGEFDIVVSYDPFSARLVRDIRSAAKVYDCVDAYEYQPQYSGRIDSEILREREREFAQQVDLRVATSGILANRKSIDWGQPVETLIGAHEIAAPAVAFRGGPMNRALLIGALDEYKVDPVPVMRWLEADKNRTLTVAGRPLRSGTAAIRRLLDSCRVKVVPPVDADGFSALASEADFGVVSLAINPYNIYSFPLKTWDYMMNGLPVVAWNAPSLRDVPGVVNGDDLESGKLLAAGMAMSESAAANHADERWKRLVESL